MKKAIMALDGGGSNLRIVVADAQTEEQLYFGGFYVRYKICKRKS